jgi:Tol biopolymer transport system component
LSHLRYGMLSVALLILISCGTSTPTLPDMPVLLPAIFTYSTIDGAVWQVDTMGNREQLIIADGIRKRDLLWSEDRRWLSYVSERFSPPQQVKTQSLHLFEQKTKTIKNLLGPVRNVNSVDWIHQNQIQAVLFDLSIDPNLPPAEVPYQTAIVSAETGKLLSLEATKARRLPSEAEMAQTRFEPIRSPDGEFAISNEVDRGRMVFYLLDANGTQVARIYDQPLDATSGFRLWSPDSHWLVYQVLGDTSQLGDLFLYDVAKRTAKKLTDFFNGGNPPSYMSNIRWAPNSKWFMFTTDVNNIANQLCFAKIDSDAAKCLDVQWKLNQINFVFSRDSRMLAFVARIGNQPHDLYAFDIESESIVQLTNNGNTEIEDWFTEY